MQVKGAAASAMLLRMAAMQMQGMVVVMGGAALVVMQLSMNWKCWQLCQVSATSPNGFR
jgi:hypothetical protein